MIPSRCPTSSAQRVEIFGGTIGDELFSLQALTIVESTFAANALASALVGADYSHNGARFLESSARFRQLDLFKSVADQCGNAFSIHSLHIGPVIRAAQEPTFGHRYPKRPRVSPPSTEIV